MGAGIVLFVWLVRRGDWRGLLAGRAGDFCRRAAPPIARVDLGGRRVARVGFTHWRWNCGHGDLWVHLELASGQRLSTFIW